MSSFPSGDGGPGGAWWKGLQGAQARGSALQPLHLLRRHFPQKGEDHEWRRYAPRVPTMLITFTLSTSTSS